MIPGNDQNSLIFPINPDTMLKERFTSSFDFMKNLVKDNTVISFFPHTKSMLKRMNIAMKEYVWLYPYVELISLDKINIISLPFGANIASMVLEELIYCNSKRFIIIGFAGSINQTVKAHNLILIDQCLKEDGVSNLYANKKFYASSSAKLNSYIENYLSNQTINYIKGSCWTIATPYRESSEKIKKYSEKDILCVDMEAAALFTIAEHYQIDMSALVSISDELSTGIWQPHFRDKEIKTNSKQLLKIAIDVLNHL